LQQTTVGTIGPQRQRFGRHDPERIQPRSEFQAADCARSSARWPAMSEACDAGRVEWCGREALNLHPVARTSS
jgi:hypothetical protein